ncbi:MAG TPA: DUF4296 domain-containing protein [Chitinophagaceae bacterium]|nr:DUF4296 domain-containing protein [Chitinophagaceae bacterium]
MNKVISFIFIFIFIACSGRPRIPKDVIKPEKMMLVMADVLKADALSEEKTRTITDSTVRKEVEIAKYYKQVFDIHNISKDDFFKSYNYYLQHPDIYKIILDSVNNRNERERKRILQKNSVEKEKRVD